MRMEQDQDAPAHGAWGLSWGRVPAPAGRRLPPRPPWWAGIAPAALVLVPWARLLHRQRPSPQLHPLELGHRHAGLDGVRHLDKGKPARAPGLSIGDDPDTLRGLSMIGAVMGSLP